jgi:hypothetical protein
MAEAAEVTVPEVITEHDHDIGPGWLGVDETPDQHGGGEK